MEAVDAFHATINIVVDMLAGERSINFLADDTELTGAFAETLTHLCLESFEFLGVKIAESKLFNLHANTPHSKAVCHWGEYLKAFTGYFYLLFTRHVLKCLEVMEPVGELNNDDANVLTDGD